MKKILSILLVLAMAFSLVMPALAANEATVSLVADKTEVRPGESVNVTLELNNPLTNVGCFEVWIYYDATLFDLTGSAKGTSCSLSKISSKSFTETTGTKHPLGTYWKVTALDAGDPMTFAAGSVYTLTFTAKADIAQTSDAAFQVHNVATQDVDSVDLPITEGNPVSVTVAPASAEPTTGYTVSMPADRSISYGETAEIPVTMGVGTEDTRTAFNAFDVTVAYDNSKLELTTSSIAGCTVTPGEGIVRIQGYGADKPLGVAFTLTFRGIAAGDAAVSFTSAKVDEYNHAIENDAPEATQTDVSATITISSYPATLSEDFTGSGVVAAGADYTFSARDLNYSYSITATMGGEPVDVIDNGDGTYTIRNVSGALIIAAVKTPKSYGVSVGGAGEDDVNYEDAATYGSDYSFTLNRQPGFAYTVTVTIGGMSYTGYSVENGVYTIPGADITGAVEVAVTKVATTASVSFEGTGAGDASGEASANLGEDYAFSVTKADGYTYTVSATIDGQAYSLPAPTPAGNVDNYTIPGTNVTGAIVITVTKAGSLALEVSEYVKFADGNSIFLVTVSGTLEEGKVFAYDGAAMYYSEKYQAYAYLIISSDDLATIETAAAEKIGTVTAAAESIAYDGDVNGTDAVDINDAQLVYNMYNADYSDFATVSILKFLRADLNGSGNLNVDDAAAAVALIP